MPATKTGAFLIQALYNFSHGIQGGRRILETVHFCCRIN
jgi:hypothetical protein